MKKHFLDKYVYAIWRLIINVATGLGIAFPILLFSPLEELSWILYGAIPASLYL